MLNLNPHYYLAQLCAEAYYIKPNTPGFAWFQLGEIIVISGTDHLLDWRDNFNFYPFTNRGFHKLYLKYATEILNEIGDNKQLIWTGHSAGGAIAELGAIISGGVSVTFGQPTFYSLLGLGKYNLTRYYMKYDPIRLVRRSVYREPLANTIILPGFGHHINKYIKALR